MQLNWQAGLYGLAGAMLGGLAGGLFAGYRNRPLEHPLLIGASIGALIGVSLSPQTVHCITTAPVEQAPPANPDNTTTASK